MEEEWGAYLCNFDGQVASVFVNLTLRESAPMADRPWAAYIHITMLFPREDGLSSKDEFDTLERLEETILREFKGAVFPGRITTNGIRTMVFYLGEECDVQAMAQRAFAHFPEYKFQTTCRHEPDWHFYVCTLYPPPEGLETIKNAKVIDVLEQHGDTLLSPREVCHWAYFDKKKDRDAFVESVEALGYTCDKMEHPEHPSGRFSAVLKRTDKVDYASINEVTLQLFRLANHHNGEYDGWETQVVAPENSTKPN